MTSNSDTDHWKVVESLFSAALELPVDERAAFIHRECGDNESLRKEIERLLDADATDSGPLDQAWMPGNDGTQLALSPLDNGQAVGAWRIVHELGRGGMGVVYLAERADGTYEQQVALKVIRGGLLTGATQSRFIRERRILGRLQHRNIARLLDAGATADGLPYLVIELVHGVTITDWCRQHKPGIEQRLRLILQVCSALQHAHRNLVVHRDLKPGNIYIDAIGDVRLLDFGVARLLSGDENDGPDATRQGMLPITPEYAAPEQLSEVDATTATDIFSLGAVLYELLANRPPRESISGSPVEIQRLLQRPVAPPSTVGDASLSWRKQVRGDLDAIVLTAMAIDPARRYLTAGDFAADIRRYLAHEPVHARPESLAYRAGKFVQRHRFGVAATLAIVMAIAAGIATTTRQARETAAQAAKAEAVKEFVLSLFEGVDPSRALGEELTARELVDDGADRMQSELIGQPLVRAEILTFLANVYDKMDDDERATELIDFAFELLDDTDSDELAQALLVQGRILVGRSEDDAGIRALERALALLTEQHRDLDAAEAMDLVAIVRTRQNDLTEATRLTESALALRLNLLGAEHTTVASSYNNLGMLSRMQGDYPSARQHYQQALDIRRRVLPADHPQLAISLNNLGALENVEGNYVRAADFFSRSLEINRRVNGESHHDTIAALNNFGFMQLRLGKLEQAQEALTEVLDYWVEQDKAEHPNALVTKVNLAAVTRAFGNAAEALPELEELELKLADKLGIEHPFVAVTLHHQARCWLDIGDLDKAQDLLARALAMREKALGADHPDSADLLRDQALIALLQGRLNKSDQLLSRTLELQRSKLPAGHPSISMSELLLGRLALANGETQDALRLQQVALQNLERLFSADYPDLAEAHFEIGKTLVAGSLPQEAEVHLRIARAAFLARFEDHSWRVAEVDVSLADALSAQGDNAAAEPMRTIAVGLIEEQLPEFHPVRKRVRNELAL